MTTEIRRPITPAAAILDPRWDTAAACRFHDPELFFPNGQSQQALAQTEEAKQVCHRCPLLDVCREWSIATEERFGVAGGLSESERRLLVTKRVRRQMPKRPSAALERCRAAGADIDRWRAEGRTVAWITGRLSVSKDTYWRWLQIAETLKAEAGQEVSA
jgi:WhiB family redox-sensing transcriptional regulator